MLSRSSKLYKHYKTTSPWRYRIYNAKQRCTNPKDPHYANYGGRGIQFQLTMSEAEELWFRDKAYLLKKPSLDRKANAGNYTFDNCRFIEHAENTAKDKMQKVGQYFLNGDLIKIWNSLREAEYYGGYDHSHVSRAIKFGCKHLGYYWMKIHAA